MDAAEALAKYSFYHCIEIAPGVITPGYASFVPLQAPVLAEINRRDLTGKRVLDIGCRDGLFSFAAEARGGSVLGIDNDLSRPAVDFLIPHLGSSVEMREVNIYDFVSDERFDLVIFAGVLYHLRAPFLGLKRIADVMVPGGTLIVETGALLHPHAHPFIYSPLPADSPFDPSSVTFFNYRAVEAGLSSLGFVDTRCVSVILPTAPPRAFASMDEFLGATEGAANGGLTIGRMTCISTYAPSPSSRALTEYWFGVHQLNSDIAAAKSFLKSSGSATMPSTSLIFGRDADIETNAPSDTQN